MGKTIIEVVKTVIATVIGYIIWALGGIDSLMTALLIFVIIDYITGVLQAIIEKRLNSKVGFKGIARKVMILIMVSVATILDVYVLQAETPLRETVIVFYIVNETLSIIENMGKMGLPIPQRLKDVLAQLSPEQEDEDKESK